MSTKARIKKSIKKESIPASDFLKYKIPLSCEDCSHFSHIHQLCTLGNRTTSHRLAEQIRSYELSGNVAFCRLLEVD